MAPVNRSSSSLYSNDDILEKCTEKKQKRKLSFGSTPNAHAERGVPFLTNHVRKVFTVDKICHVYRVKIVFAF